MVKQEPETYSWTDFVGDGRTDWLEPVAFKKALDEAKKKAILQNAAP